VEECSTTIVQEVESLKLLVDEFSQFARMPAPRTVPADLNELVTEALGLYRGLFQELRIDVRPAPALPPVRVDPEQFRRVVINLVDNAIEAMTSAPGGPPPEGGLVTVDTQHDAPAGVVRLVIADNGPGISEADRGSCSCRTTRRRAWQRSRPRHRAAHRGGARRQHRGRGEPAARDADDDRVAVLTRVVGGDGTIGRGRA